MEIENNPLISLIIVLKNNEKTIEQCIKSILNLNYKNFELILLDNNSDDNTWEIVKCIKDPRIRLFKSNFNYGFAAGNNLCFKKSKGKWLLGLNPDVIVDKDLIEKLISAYNFLSKKYNTDKIILSPKILLKDNKINYFGGSINILGFSTTCGIGKPDNIKVKYYQTDFFSGCCFFIKRKHYEELNGFDPKYFMYHEDVDLSLRARLQGFKIFVINTTKIIHLKNLKDFKLNKFKYFLVERNRIITLIKNSFFLPYTILMILIFEPILFIQALLDKKLKIRALIYTNLIKNFKKYFDYNNKLKNKLILRYKITFEDIEHLINSNKTSLIIKILNIYLKIIYTIFWKRFYKNYND